MTGLKHSFRGERVIPLAEVVWLFLWALWVGRAFLDPHADTWPFGWDFALTLEPYHIWGLLSRCGACVLWNGSINGGYPAFAELHGAVLHPLVVIPALIWGTLLGSKITFVLSLFVAGLGQWWLARVMGLGRLTRVWVGAMAIAGGHLAGRMQLGLSGLVLSAACGSLVLAATVDLASTARRRSAIGLGVALALTLLSAQGYVQLALLLAFLPALGALLWESPIRWRPVWREFVLAGVLAVLIAGIFLVPGLHFAPEVGKLTDDPLTGTEPLGYVPVNLVVRDLGYYAGMDMERIELPAMYMNYIGWLPIALALYAFHRARGDKRRLAGFLGLSTFIVFFIASEAFVRPLAGLAPGLAAAYRYPALVTIMAVPPILGLSAWGLEELLQDTPHHPWFSAKLGPAGRVRTRHLLAVVFAALALRSVYQFGQEWLQTETFPPDLRRVAEALLDGETAWVTLPQEHYWVAYALEAGNKVTDAYRPWFWRGRELPPARRVASRADVPPEGARALDVIGDILVAEFPDRHYAAIQTEAAELGCDGRARGGDIDVTCTSDAAGILTVAENAFSGWAAWRDGERIALEPSMLLRVQAPAGIHEYRFRYRPWDVWAGALLSLAGLALALRLWLIRPSSPAASRAGQAGA